MRRRAVFRIIVTVVLMACAFVEARAQSPLEARLEAAGRKIEAACGNDVRTLCSNVTPGQGRLMLCVMAHEDKISGRCDYALYEASRNLERALDRISQVADACWTDVERLCGAVPGGGGRIAACLLGNRQGLSPACQATLARFPALR